MKMAGEPKSRYRVMRAMILSIICSIGIFAADKYRLSSLSFYFATTLESWHMLATFCVLHVQHKLNLFEFKTIDQWVIILFSIVNAASFALMDLSLGTNSVGFYQMTKLALIPFTMLLETVFLAKKFSLRIKASLLILLIGVGIGSVTDTKLNLVGFLLAVASVAVTCVSQVLINQIQKRLKVSSTQLLYQSAPYQAVALFMVGPSIDKLLSLQDVFTFKYTPDILLAITLSCLIAVCLNYLAFLLIGMTSPITYQVLGQLNTCLILVVGHYVAKDPFTSKTKMGILIALVGMILYAWFSTRDTEGSQSLPTVAQERDDPDSERLVYGASWVVDPRGVDSDSEGQEGLMMIDKAMHGR